MMQSMMNMFTRKDSHRNAVLALARIISRYDLMEISYERGLRDNRREKDEHRVSWGVWLFPCAAKAKARDFTVSNGVPAVTHDIRGEGLGISTPVALKSDYFIVALPDEEDDSWKFFRGEVRHNTRRPGGWFHFGIQIESTINLEQSQVVDFRKHIERVQSAVG